MTRYPNFDTVVASSFTSRIRSEGVSGRRCYETLLSHTVWVYVVSIPISVFALLFWIRENRIKDYLTVFFFFVLIVHGVAGVL